jgi:single-stranded DNA-specific DHH superfamily exonuclease
MASHIREDTSMSFVFKRREARKEAEKLLDHGIQSGSWSAAGFALITDRLDQIAERLDRVTERMDRMAERLDRLVELDLLLDDERPVQVADGLDELKRQYR